MTTQNEVGAADRALSAVIFNPMIEEPIFAPRAHFSIVCVDAEGVEKWREEIDNLVTTVGKTDIVDKYLKGSAYTAAWYLVLKGSGTIAVGDTLASHAGWTELTPYSGTNRPTITWGTTSAGSNTSTAVAISVNATATVAGAGIAVTQLIATTTGVLYNMADFSAARSVASGDTLNVTCTVSVT